MHIQGGMMRIGIIVDAACDLPEGFEADHGIVILPTSVKIKDREIHDHHNPLITQSFLDSDIIKSSGEAQTDSYTVEQIRELFLTRMVVEFDHVFCLTITSSSSQIYERAVQASFNILSDYHPIRSAAGFNTPFAMRVLDTRTMFAGQTITALEAVRMRDAGENPQAIRTWLDRIVENTHLYVISQDLHHLRNRGKARGIRSVGLVGAVLGTALDVKPTMYCHRGDIYPVAKLRGIDTAAQNLFSNVIRDIRAGLMVNTVTLSFGGPLEQVHALPGYDALKQTCVEAGVELLEMVMSLTGIVNLGRNALSIAYAREGEASLR